MKASKFNEEQIALALHMAEQTSVDEVTESLGSPKQHFTVGNRSMEDYYHQK